MLNGTSLLAVRHAPVKIKRVAIVVSLQECAFFSAYNRAKL